MEKFMECTLLIDIYSKLLTENQNKVINMYYSEDLSLSEIGDLVGISKQGVRDTLKKAEHKLYEFEGTLKILQDRLSRDRDLKTVLRTCSIDDKARETLKKLVYYED